MLVFLFRFCQTFLDWLFEPLLVQILLGSDSVKGGLDMTVTLCHRYTPSQDLADAVQASDLVVSALLHFRASVSLEPSLQERCFFV